MFKSSDNDKIVDYMNEIVSRGYLPSLQKLGINRWINHWNRLQKLFLVDCPDDVLHNITDAVCWGFLPVLQTLCIKHYVEFNADIARLLSQLDVIFHET